MLDKSSLPGLNCAEIQVWKDSAVSGYNVHQDSKYVSLLSHIYTQKKDKRDLPRPLLLVPTYHLCYS